MPVEPVELLERCIKIYSPTGRERRVAAFLSEQMRRLGYRRVRIDGAGNAVGEVGRGKLKVLLCGHVDTVPGKLPVALRGGLLSGRGAVDAKSAACAMLVAAARFVGDPSLHVTVACATGEEGDSVGVKELIDGRSKYDFAVFGEPGGADRITLGYRGRVGVKVRLSTGGGHAGSSWAHRSAFEEALRLITELKAMEGGAADEKDHFHSLSVSVVTFESGEYHNVVPSNAMFALDVRVPPRSKSSEVKKAMARRISEFSAKSGVRVVHEFGEATEPYEAPASSLLVRAFQRAILLRAKARPIFVRKTGTGDMNTFAEASRAQSLTYGPGDSRLSHTSKEAIKVSDYLLSIEVLTEALSQLKQLARA